MHILVKDNFIKTPSSIRAGGFLILKNHK